MFFKLAVNNVRRSFRDYAIYFFTLSFGVCLFYVFNSMDSQQAMLALSENQKEIMQLLVTAIGYVSVFISFILGFLVVYSNRFLMKRRKKELGIYMLLGMGKGKISRILALETLFIGIFSLGIGLIVGIFASQGLSVIISGIFEVDLSSFQFSFSIQALWKTVLYFGIIFVAVMLFNTVSISKYKLITLLQASRKNESFKVRNLAVSVIAFVLGVGCLGTAYYLVLEKIWPNIADNGITLLWTAVILGCVGTFLFFFSLSGILLRVIKANKRLYYKGLNMFLFRQISSKINTTFFSCAVICLMLFMTLVTFSVGNTVAFGVSQTLQSVAPFDLTIAGRLNSLPVYDENGAVADFAEPDTTSLTEALTLTDVLNSYAKDYFEIKVYNSMPVSGSDDASEENYLTMGKLSNILPDLDAANATNSFLNLISLTDYNRVRNALGMEPITLAETEFAVNCNNFYVEKYYKMENDQSIEVNGKTYTLGIHRLLNTSYQNAYFPDDAGTLVLPDDALIDIPESFCHRLLNVLYKNTESKAATQTTGVINSIMSSNAQNVDDTTKLTYYNPLDKETIYLNSVGGTVLLSFLSIYIGLVFLLTCVATLALQQLAETSDNVARYNLLRKLGADSRMIHRTLLWQIAVYFAVPLVLAVIHTVIAIQFSGIILDMFSGRLNTMTFSLITVGMMALVYGGYFGATYLFCRGMLRQKKT